MEDKCPSLSHHSALADYLLQQLPKWHFCEYFFLFFLFFDFIQCEASEVSSRPKSKPRWCVCGAAPTSADASELFPAIIAALQTRQTLLFPASAVCFTNIRYVPPKVHVCLNCFTISHNPILYSDCLHETFNNDSWCLITKFFIYSFPFSKYMISKLHCKLKWIFTSLYIWASL